MLKRHVKRTWHVNLFWVSTPLCPNAWVDIMRGLLACLLLITLCTSLRFSNSKIDFYTVVILLCRQWVYVHGRCQQLTLLLHPLHILLFLHIHTNTLISHYGAVASFSLTFCFFVGRCEESENCPKDPPTHYPPPWVRQQQPSELCLY